MSYPHNVWVCADGEWINQRDIDEFVDIEESLNGDLMTFIYKGKTYKSLIVIGSKPGN